jgi:hypothetical protein
MTQNLGDQRWIFSAGGNEGTVWPEAKKCPSEAVARAGNHSEVTATNRAGLDIDGEDPLEALCPSHRGGVAERRVASQVVPVCMKPFPVPLC